jgi:hypothetical protein
VAVPLLTAVLVAAASPIAAAQDASFSVAAAPLLGHHTICICLKILGSHCEF